MSKLIVISSPSGGGKTSIVTAILKKNPEINFSISATTRSMRPSETNGKEYFFFSREEFEKGIKNSEMVEYEEIYGNFYGTLKCEIDRAIKENKNMIFDVDVKGAISIKKQFPEITKTIFISPPSIEELKKRLENRNTEDSETINKRVLRAEFEIELGKNFDYNVTNNILDETILQVEDIIKNKII